MNQSKEYIIGYNDAIRGLNISIPESNGDEYAQGFRDGQRYLFRINQLNRTEFFENNVEE